MYVLILHVCPHTTIYAHTSTCVCVYLGELLAHNDLKLDEEVRGGLNKSDECGRRRRWGGSRRGMGGSHTYCQAADATADAGGGADDWDAWDATVRELRQYLYFCTSKATRCATARC